MEDKIEIGEYVRTDKGNIGKVIKERLAKAIDTGEIITEYILDTGKWTTAKYIKKHSSNIIDIIEEGDYVNGQEVICFRNKDCNYDIGTEYADDWGEYFGVDKEDIKNILTHEQYEANCYRLED